MKEWFSENAVPFHPKLGLACGSGFRSVHYLIASDMPVEARRTDGNAGAARDEFAACFSCFQGCLNAHDLQ